MIFMLALFLCIVFTGRRFLDRNLRPVFLAFAFGRLIRELSLGTVGHEDIGVVQLGSQVVSHRGDVFLPQFVPFFFLFLGKLLGFGFSGKSVDPLDHFFHRHCHHLQHNHSDNL